MLRREAMAEDVTEKAVLADPSQSDRRTAARLELAPRSSRFTWMTLLSDLILYGWAFARRVSPQSIQTLPPRRGL